MYAYDTTLLLNSSDPNALQNDLNSNLDKIADWFQANKVTLNIKKTKLMMLVQSNLFISLKMLLLYIGVSIERVEKFKYLGLSLDTQLSWNEHVCKLSVFNYFLNQLGLFIELSAIYQTELYIC